MKSLVMKRSVVIEGHKTSVSLEDAFWLGLKELAHDDRTSVASMVADIDTQRRQGNLSSAIRLFVLDRMRGRLSAPTSALVETNAAVHQNGQHHG